MRALTTATGIPAASTLVQHARPELGFGQDEQLWPKLAEIGPHRGGEIEWVVKNILGAKAFAGYLLTGTGCRGDNDPIVGHTGSKCMDKSTDGDDFADRDGMDPNNRPAMAR